MWGFFFFKVCLLLICSLVHFFFCAVCSFVCLLVPFFSLFVIFLSSQWDFCSGTTQRPRQRISYLLFFIFSSLWQARFFVHSDKKWICLFLFLLWSLSFFKNNWREKKQSDVEQESHYVSLTFTISTSKILADTLSSGCYWPEDSRRCKTRRISSHVLTRLGFPSPSPCAPPAHSPPALLSLLCPLC